MFIIICLVKYLWIHYTWSFWLKTSHFSRFFSVSHDLEEKESDIATVCNNQTGTMKWPFNCASLFYHEVALRQLFIQGRCSSEMRSTVRTLGRRHSTGSIDISKNSHYFLLFPSFLIFSFSFGTTAFSRPYTKIMHTKVLCQLQMST
jgi:hypothetical protein